MCQGISIFLMLGRQEIFFHPPSISVINITQFYQILSFPLDFCPFFDHNIFCYETLFRIFDVFCGLLKSTRASTMRLIDEQYTQTPFYFTTGLPSKEPLETS